MKRDLTKQEYDLAKYVARWHTRFQAALYEDMYQHLLTEAFANHATILRWREDPDGAKILKGAMSNWAKKYFRQDRERAAAYRERVKRVDNEQEGAVYTTAAIAKILPYIWKTGGTQLDLNSQVFAMINDVSNAYAKLSPDLRQIVAERYRDDLSLKDVTALHAYGERNVQLKIQQALRQMRTYLLGSEW